MNHSIHQSVNQQSNHFFYHIFVILTIQIKLSSFYSRARRGRTNIDGALHEVIYLFENFKGFAKDQEIYLISDGKWNDGKNPAEGIKKLNKRGVKLRILDVGRNADKSAFDFIISAPCKDCYHGLPKNDKDQKRLIKKLTQKESKYHYISRNMCFFWKDLMIAIV